MLKSDGLRRTIGVNFEKNGEATVKVWAPLATSLALKLDKKTYPLQKKEDGYWEGRSLSIKPGDRYLFILDGEKELPDPASLSQPDGVHGASAAVNLSEFRWTDDSWKSIPLEQYIIYELHTGAFSPEGSFEGIEKKLDHLLNLGVNAIEIMPVAQFPGARNWGYDGVFPFAVQNSYGGAAGLQKLVNTCHQKGIAVILDVVYNHLGPEGNYLGAYGPFFTDKYKTPWGGAINFDDAWCDGVRRYFIENALMWFRDFHIDALRLDAVHAIKDFSPKHILREIREAVDLLTKASGKTYQLIVELDLNDNRFIEPLEKNGYGMHAQWIDEFHHALRVTALGERTGYYEDFNGLEHLAKAYRDAYVYDGQFSSHRKKKFGVKTDNPGQQFIVFSQNHDQVGNRMLGERISALASFEMQKLLVTAVLVSPYLPMLFMGEEWSEPHPFLYFVSHTDAELADAVRKGRKAEFAAFHSQGEAPDPVAEETFHQSTLQWQLLEEHPHQVMLAFYKNLIHLRKTQPALFTLNRKQLLVEADKEKCVLTLHRWAGNQHLVCFMNFSGKTQFIMPPSMATNWKLLLDTSAPQWNGTGQAPASLSGGTPGASTLQLAPESALIYADNVITNVS